jgi:hypothetical protein
MTFIRCDSENCHACDICDILDDLAEDLDLDAAISLVLHCVSQVYDIEVVAGSLEQLPDFDEVIH